MPDFKLIHAEEASNNYLITDIYSATQFTLENYM